MIKKYSLLTLEKAINHALSLDAHTLSKIEKLDGKKLEVIVAPLGINFYICFEGKILKLKDNIDGKADTTIYSSPLGLIRLSFLPASKARSLFNDKIRLSGDVELGNEVKRLFDELDIDWEGHLAQFTGDVVAHQLGSFARKTLAFKNHFSHSLRNSLTDYLQEELTLFPPREEINDFFDDIDELSLRVERLQAKMNQLMASL